MKYSHLELLGLMLDDLKFSGAPRKALKPLTSLLSEASDRDATEFNDIKIFASFTTRALETQRGVLEALGEKCRCFVTVGIVLYGTS